ncbi:hypothetical protein B0H13DRAFT_1922545 [Mycena leptocephala]|nr:hypothetical protein B0H13DRAFT_1922545 [Mycena leptocephala]
MHFTQQIFLLFSLALQPQGSMMDLLWCKVIEDKPNQYLADNNVASVPTPDCVSPARIPLAPNIVNGIPLNLGLLLDPHWIAIREFIVSPKWVAHWGYYSCYCSNYIAHCGYNCRDCRDYDSVLPKVTGRLVLLAHNEVFDIAMHKAIIWDMFDPYLNVVPDFLVATLSHFKPSKIPIDLLKGPYEVSEVRSLVGIFCCLESSSSSLIAEYTHKFVALSMSSVPQQQGATVEDHLNLLTKPSTTEINILKSIGNVFRAFGVEASKIQGH